MARSPAFSAATEQARLQAVIAAAGSGAKLWVYAGTQPGGPDTASHGQTLLAGPFVFPATLGTASSTAPATLTIDCTATPACIPAVTGTPTWWRLTTSAGSDGSAGLADGSAGTAGTVDLLLPVVIAGRPIGIKSWAISSFETLVSATIGSTEAVDVLASTVTFPQPAGTQVTNQRTGTVYSGTGAIQTAINAAIAGDMLLVAAGQTYSAGISINKAITLKSTVSGTKWLVNGTGLGGSAVCIGIDAAATIVIEDAEIYGNKIEWNYNPGVTTRVAGANVTLRRCLVRDNSNGWLGSNTDTTGVILFENCEFRDNGDYNGLTHNIYASGASLTMRGCWSRESFYVAPGGADRWKVSWGHLVKSRARVTTLEGCRLTMENGEANRCVDLPNGGDFTMRGCLLEYNTRQNAGGGQFISFGVEEALNPAALPVHKINCQQNTFVNHGAGGSSSYLARFVFWIMTNASGVPAPSVYSVIDNVFAGDYLPANKDGYYGAEGNVYSISSGTNTVISSANMTAQMPSHATYDFTLSAPVAGTQNWAQYYYAHPTIYVARADYYRGGVPSGTVVNGVWTPIKDGSGTITDASWAELPLNMLVEWSGTSLQSQLSAPYGIAGGLTFTDYGTEGIAAHFDDWCGMAFDNATGRFWGFGGGHAGSSNNLLSMFDARKGTWSVAIPPTANEYMPAAYKQTGLENYTSVPYPSGNVYGYFPSAETPPGDNKPVAMHTYGGLEYVNGIVVKIRSPQFFGNKYSQASVDASTPAWAPGGTASRNLGGVEEHAVAYGGFLYWGMEGGQTGDNQYWTIIKYNPNTGQEVSSFGVSGGGAFILDTLATQTTNNKWFIARVDNGAFSVMNLDSGTLSTSGTLSGRIPGYGGNYEGGLGCTYVSDIGKVVLLNMWLRSGGADSGEWVEIDPDTGSCITARIVDPYSKTPGMSVNRSIHTRIRYWSSKKVLILHSRTMQNARVVRFG